MAAGAQRQCDFRARVRHRKDIEPRRALFHPHRDASLPVGDAPTNRGRIVQRQFVPHFQQQFSGLTGGGFQHSKLLTGVLAGLVEQE